MVDSCVRYDIVVSQANSTGHAAVVTAIEADSFVAQTYVSPLSALAWRCFPPHPHHVWL